VYMNYIYIDKHIYIQYIVTLVSTVSVRTLTHMSNSY
jgi:hypothetical protein